MNRKPFKQGLGLILGLGLLIFAAAACQSPTPQPTSAPPTAAASPESGPKASPGPGQATSQTPSTPEAQAAKRTGSSDRVEPAPPLAPEAAAPPARLSIPAIDMDLPVQPMGWRISEITGERTTVWVLPEAAAGWHPNSGLAGATGNVVISGHQLLGDAVFAPLALGEAAVGQDIFLADRDGRTFVYRISEVSEPVPISTDLDQERALAARYTAQGDDAILTLISGWPDYTSTHRIFVIATFLGAAR